MLTLFRRSAAVSASARRGFHALVTRSAKDVAESGAPTAEIVDFSCTSELPRQDPDADIEISVSHSDLNYKDGAATPRTLARSTPRSLHTSPLPLHQD
jgi:hypothetical protein